MSAVLLPDAGFPETGTLHLSRARYWSSGSNDRIRTSEVPLLLPLAFRDKPNMLQLLEQKDFNTDIKNAQENSAHRSSCQRIYSAHLGPCSFSRSTNNKLSDSSASFLLFYKKRG